MPATWIWPGLEIRQTGGCGAPGQNEGQAQNDPELFHTSLLRPDNEESQHETAYSPSDSFIHSLSDDKEQ